MHEAHSLRVFHVFFVPPYIHPTHSLQDLCKHIKEKTPISPLSSPSRKILIPLIHGTQHQPLIPPHMQLIPLPLLKIDIQVPARHHAQLLTAAPAYPQLAPCTAPLALAIVYMANHATHGLEHVGTPDVVLVIGVARAVRRCDGWDECLGERNGRPCQRSEWLEFGRGGCFVDWQWFGVIIVVVVVVVDEDGWCGGGGLGREDCGWGGDRAV
jgi:hypothetical protein